MTPPRMIAVSDLAREDRSLGVQRREREVFELVTGLNRWDVMVDHGATASGLYRRYVEMWSK